MNFPTKLADPMSPNLLNVYTPDQLVARCDKLGASEYIVEGLLPQQSLGILVGSSGSGKTPLIYQLAMCIAAGVPFLGHAVQQGPVLYMDHENGLEQVKEMIQQLARHLQLPSPPENLRCWNRNDCDEQWGEKGHTLEDVIKAVCPKLVIVDTLSAQFPTAESKNEAANAMYARLRVMMGKFQTSFLSVHHLRKPSEERGAIRLENGDLRDYFNQVRGASSLINACDIRLAVDAPIVPSFLSGSDEVALVVRGYGRVSGEIPMMRLGRLFDDEGDPLGYRLLSGVEILGNAEHQAAFANLPPTFRFREAKLLYGKGSQPTTDLLRKCIAAGLLRKTASGYEKIDGANQEQGGQQRLAA